MNMQNMVFTNYLVKQCEAELLTSMEVQADAFRLTEEYFFHQLFKLKQLTDSREDKGLRYTVKLVEDIVILCTHLIRSEDKFDYGLAILNFVKLRTNKSFLVETLYDNLLSFFEKTFDLLDDEESESFVVQSESINKTESLFEGVRCFLDKYDEVKHSPIISKLHKFMMYAMSMSLFDSIGVSLENFNFSKFEIEAAKKKYWLGPDFVYTVLDTLLFLCERGYQCVQTGSMDPIYHSAKSYEKWFNDVTDIKAKAKLLNDPELFGFTESQFFADLDRLIEAGEAIYRHATRLGDFEKGLCRTFLQDLKFIRCEQMTYARAREQRECPMSILLTGNSSIGKSTLQSIHFTQFGKVFGLPVEDKFCYVKSPSASFWDGFRSYMWCIVLDDIAFMNPQVASSGGDPSIMEMLNIVNYVPHTPDQAALEDKGKIPLRCKFVISTTNTEHLNAASYFSCPVAVQRRLPYVVRVKPKDEYATAGCLDSLKVPAYEGYPDYWEFEVCKVTSVPPPPGIAGVSRHSKLVVIGRYDNIYRYMEWFNKVIKEHAAVQKKIKSSTRAMAELELCKGCHLPAQGCSCEFQVQTMSEEQAQMVSEDARLMISDSNESTHTDDTQDAHDSSFQLFVWLWAYMCAISQQWIIIPLGVWICKVLMFSYVRFRLMRWWLGLLWRIPLIGPVLHLWFFCDSMVRLTKTRLFWRAFGADIERRIGRVPLLISITATLGAGFVAYKSIRAIAKFFTKGDKSQTNLYQTVESVWSEDEKLNYHRHETNNGNVISDIRVSGPSSKVHSMMGCRESLQGGNQSKPLEEVGSPPITSEVERTPVWYKDSYQLTTFDINPKSTSYNALTDDQLENLLLRNCVHFSIKMVASKYIDTVNIRAVCVRNSFYMTNNHAFKSGFNNYIIAITQCGSKDGVNGNITVNVSEMRVKRFPELDIAIINLLELPPKKDIVPLFSRGTLRGDYNAMMLGRCRDGDTYKNMVRHVTLVEQYYVPALGTFTNTWMGFANEYTKVGDCGSIMVARTGLGPVILGIHYIGGENAPKVGSIAVTSEFLEENTTDMVVQCAPPLFSTPTVNRVLSDLHKKSPMRFIREGNGYVYGSFVGFRSKARSHVQQTFMCKEMMSLGYKIEHGPPIMNSWEPAYQGAFDLSSAPTLFDVGKLEVCIKCYFDDVVRKLPPGELETLKMYDMKTAINGVPNVSYVDKINRNTSAGFPWKKSKKYFMFPIQPYGDTLDPVDVTDEVKDRVRHCLEMMREGIVVQPIFTASLKDEPTSFKKIKIKKTRIFMASPLDFTILTKMVLGSFVRLVLNNQACFESAVGVVAQSTEWERIAATLILQGFHRIIAGDYKKYDKTMMAALIMMIFYAIADLHKKAGCDREHYRFIICLGVGIAYALIDYFGDLVQFFIGNPSGHGLTTIINCIANSSLMRYAFGELFPKVDLLNELEKPNTNLWKDIIAKFTDFVTLWTFGDDNISSVSEEAPWFNHTAVQRVFAEHNLEYTMADKDATSVPYISLDKATFLKRTWRWDEDVGALVAPLDHESINKMLTMCVRSKTISPEAQAIESMDSALREYFWYGKDIFNYKRQEWQKICDKLDINVYIEDWHFPSWEKLYDDFWRNSSKIKFTRPELKGLSLNQNLVHRVSYCSPNLMVLQAERVEYDVNLLGRSPKFVFTKGASWSPNIRSNLDMEWVNHIFVQRPAQQNNKHSAVVTYNCNNQHKRKNSLPIKPAIKRPYPPQSGDRMSVQADDSHNELLAMSDKQLGALVRDTWVDGQHLKFKRMLVRHHDQLQRTNLKLVDVKIQRKLMLELRDNLLAAGEQIDLNLDQMNIQSESSREVMSEEKQSDTTTAENLTFHDENAGLKIVYPDGGEDSPYNDNTRSLKLDNFLSRPVKIETITWSQASGAVDVSTINPWYLYLNNTAIKKKLDNFAFIRGNLHLTVKVNCSQFLYGSMLMSYSPLQGLWSNTIANDGGGGEVIPLSQRPHIWVLPQLSQAGDIVLPFVYHKNWLNATSATDTQNMGTLRSRIVNILKSANGTTGNVVTVQIYAWMENVELMAPTSSLALQADSSRKNKDEYAMGVVSKPASAIATATGLLGETPIIGPYMTATSWAATAVAKIAHLFGYTNVPNIRDVDPIKNMPFGHFASSEISTPIEKLTLDPKNELSIDPRLVGLDGKDELAIDYIASKESFLTSFIMDPSYSVDDLLFSTVVTPAQFYCFSGDTYPHMQCTPMGYIQHMFKYWRGSIIFRFRIIASPFHKGRLRVTYDPIADIRSDAGTHPVCLTEIIDISKENDVEVEIPYLQALSWCNTTQATISTIPWASNTTCRASVSGSDNGYLTVRVETQLGAPVSTADIRVQVFVRAGSSFELGYPVEPPQTATRFQVQSCETRELLPDTRIMGPKTKNHPARYLINFGERVTSLRQVLRRANYSETITIPASTTDVFARWRSIVTRLPLQYGYDPNGVHTAKGTATPGSDFNFNYVKITAYNWLSGCYLAQRGSMIWHYNVDTTGSDGVLASCRFLKTSGTFSRGNHSEISGTASGTLSSYAKWFTAAKGVGSAGSVLTNQNTQTGWSVVVPHMTKYRFAFCDQYNTTLGSSKDDSNIDGYSAEITFKPSASTKAITGVSIDKYVSAGPDFNFYFFLNAPSFYYLSSPTAG